MLAFHTGSAILRLTMTDKFNYQDVYKTINIPQKERRLATTAKDLLDSSYGMNGWRPEVFQHLSKLVDTPSATQAFWDFENDEQAEYDRLVLTLAGRGLTLAVEHRNFDRGQRGTRSSMHIENGISTVYFSDLQHGGYMGLGEKSREARDIFKWQFSDAIANLGLYSHIKALRQNESNAAILANAA